MKRVAALLLLVSSAARAGDSEMAQALFDEGKRLLRDGDYARACSKLGESQRIDPGLGTLLYLSECRARRGQWASAWKGFQSAIAIAQKRGDAREALARKRMRELEPRLQSITIVIGKPMLGLEVRADGVELEPSHWGAPIPVDPGTHVVSAVAPGRKKWETNVVVGPEDPKSIVTVPALEEEPQPPLEVKTRLPSRKRAMGTQKIVGITAASAGLFGLGVGTAFGVAAMSKYNASNDQGHCRSNGHCDAIGVALRSDALELAAGSTASFILGGAALAIGVVVYVIAPSEKSTVSIGPTGVMFQREF